MFDPYVTPNLITSNNSDDTNITSITETPQHNPQPVQLDPTKYGLKQASRTWFNAFSNTLLRNGFKQSKYDYSLFTTGEGDNFIAILFYVDDIILASVGQEIISIAKTILKEHFKL